MEDRVHHEGQQKDKTNTKDHCTELNVSPVDDVKDYREQETQYHGVCVCVCV